MDKRGQVTLYVILGIVIVATTLIVLYLKTNVFLFNPSYEDLEGELADIRDHAIQCLKGVSDDPLRTIGLQGGYLATPDGTYRLYNDTQVSYLCYNMEDTSRCMNRMLTKLTMEEELQNNLDYLLRNCLNVQGFKKFGGFDIFEGDWKTDVDIRENDVVVKLDYPVTLRSKRSDVEVSMSGVSTRFGYPLGYLYDISQDVVNTEAIYGEFDQFIYMLNQKGKVRVDKKRPYPDKLYVMNQRGEDYIFQFFVQGEPT